MACSNCGSDNMKSWTTLDRMDINNLPDDLELVCGSDKELKSGRIPLAYIIDRLKELEKEVGELKNG